MNKNDNIAKEFYAQYGSAMHNYQMLERGLLELFALNKYFKFNLTEKEYYIILSNPSKWTLGRLINEIKIFDIFDFSNTELLNKANETRIFLAHMFWWERDIEFENHENLVILHKEISSYIDLCCTILLIIDKIISKTRNDYNIKIEEKMELTDFKEREAYIKSLKIKD